MKIESIAYFHSPFKKKFGIPKQSGIVETLPGQIVFVPTFRNRDALRGIEGFDYLWLLWGFSANPHAATNVVVRPPLLGGNERMGVFATRSPFRPNAIGLSSVKLQKVDYEAVEGPIIHVLGADLMDGTPIYDIKPYVTLSDCHPDAHCGFVDSNAIRKLNVIVDDRMKVDFDSEELEKLIEVLRLDPRPHYHNDPERVYGMLYNDRNVRFKVIGTNLHILTAERVKDNE